MQNNSTSDHMMSLKSIRDTMANLPPAPPRLDRIIITKKQWDRAKLHLPVQDVIQFPETHLVLGITTLVMNNDEEALRMAKACAKFGLKAMVIIDADPINPWQPQCSQANNVHENDSHG